MNNRAGGCDGLSSIDFRRGYTYAEVTYKNAIYKADAVEHLESISYNSTDNYDRGIRQYLLENNLSIDNLYK